MKNIIEQLKCVLLLGFAYHQIAFADTNEIAGTRNAVTFSGQLDSISPRLKSFRWQIMNQTRTRDDSSQGMRLTDNLLSGQIGYAFDPNISISIGYLHAWIHPLDKLSYQENRPYEDFLWSYTRGNLKFISRSRLEQRIRIDNNVLGLRVRELMQVTYSLGFIDKDLTAYLGDELLGYLNSNTFGHTGFNENRALVGFNYKLTKEISIDLGYVGQYIPTQTAQVLLIHNVQFNLGYKF